MARTLIDAHRSLARYIAQILPEFDVWSLRTEPQEHRPYAVVKPVQVPPIRAQSKQIIDISQPFSVYIYPAIAATAIEGQHNKLQIEEALYSAFFVQLASRVPFYDYTTGGLDDGGVPDGSAVPYDHPGPSEQAVSAFHADGTPAAYDYLLVREYQIHAAQDATDERRWTITLTLRLAWRRYGRLLSGIPVQTVRVTSPDGH